MAQAEWDRVRVPENISFDPAKNYPFSPQLHAYIDKLITELPKNENDLKYLYHFVGHISKNAFNTPEEKKEQYRLNILRGIIPWVLQQHYFLREWKVEQIPRVSALQRVLSTHQAIVAQLGLYAYDETRNLGDCLFDNIAAQLEQQNLEQLSAHQLRQNVVEFMRHRAAFYSPRIDLREGFNHLERADGSNLLTYRDWNGYLACLAIPLTWATELEIHALTFMLNQPLVLIAPGHRPKIYNKQEHKLPLILYHRNGNHFVSCRPLENRTIAEAYGFILNQSHDGVQDAPN